MSKSAVQTL